MTFTKASAPPVFVPHSRAQMTGTDVEETILPFRAQDERKLERVEIEEFKFELAKPPAEDTAFQRGPNEPDDESRRFDKRQWPTYATTALTAAASLFIVQAPWLLALAMTPLAVYPWRRWRTREARRGLALVHACELVFSRDQVLVRVDHETVHTFSTSELSEFLPKSSLPGERRLVVQPMSGPMLELALRFLSHEEMVDVGAAANEMLRQAKAKGALPFR